MKKIIASSENPTLVSLTNKCEAFGYHVQDAFWDRDRLRVYITPDNNRYGGYLPEISCLGSGKLSGVQWKAETVSYGFLTIDEYEKYSQAVEAAYQVLEILNSFDYSELERINETDM